MRPNNHQKRPDLGSLFRKVGASVMGTALLASTNLTTAALANGQGGRGPAMQQFRLDNPGLSGGELKALFNAQWNGGNNGAAGAAANAVNNVVNNGAVGAAAPQLKLHDFSTKADFQAYKQTLRQQQQIQNLNQSIQQTGTDRTVSATQGFSLDLSSAVESITLGNNLFRNQPSITINVGGQEKTLGAGSRVTAAEYVAAKQALSGAQGVTLDGTGRATGGNVDLSVISNNNKAVKVDDFVVPVSVTATGDFSKHGDIRITGDLTNSGSIVANGGNVNAWIGADNITNNAGATITSNVNHLVLDADRAFANYGTITANGSLTVAGGESVTNTGNISARNSLNVYSPNVTNSGNLASTKGNVTFDAIASNMNINNTNGTVSALNGAINIREAGYDENFNTVVNGGDWLSKDLNANAGGGTIDMNVGQMTGTVNSTGYATHVTAQTDTLTIGGIDLVDPTFKNTGNILVNGNVLVTDNLAIISGGTITVSNNVTIQSTYTGLPGSAGSNITMIAGANVAAAGNQSGNVPAPGPALGAGQTASIDGTTVSTAAGGDLVFGTNTQIISTSSLGTAVAGGNVKLIALQGTGLTTGGNITATGLTINTIGDAGAGNVDIWVGGTNIVKNIGNITTNFAGASGAVNILAVQAANSNPGTNIVYTDLGVLQLGSPTFQVPGLPAGLVNTQINLNGTINSGDAATTVRSAGLINLVGNTSGQNVTLQSTTNTVTGAGNVTANAASGTADLTGTTISTTGLTSGFNVNLTASTGNIGTGINNRVLINATNLTANATAVSAGNGNIWINEQNGVSVNASTANKQFALNTLSAGTLTVAGLITSQTQDVQLTTFAGGGSNIALNAGVTANTTAALTADGSINWTAGTITAPTTTLVATNGSIGASGFSVNTAANTLTLTANNGSVFVSEADGASVNASGANTTTGTFALNMAGAGTFALNGAINGNTIQITAANAASLITANNTIGSAATASTQLQAGSNINTSNTILGSSINIQSTGGFVTLGGAVGNASTTSTILNAETNLTNTGAILGTTINMSSDTAAVNINGTVGNAASGVTVLAQTNVATTQAINGTSIGITATTGTITAGANIGTVGTTTTDTLQANGSITGTGTIAGTTVSLTSTGGNIGTDSVNRARTAAGTLNLSAAAGNVFASEADAVNLNTAAVLAGGQFLLNTLGTGTMNVNANVAANTVNLTTVNAGSDIVVGNAFTVGAAAGSTTVVAGGTVSTGALGSGGQIVGNTVALTASNGNIGVDATTNRLNVNAGSLTLTANAGGAGVGNAWINEADAVSINASSVNKQLFLDTQALGNITVAGLVTGNDVRLTNRAATTSDILLNAAITGSGANPNITLTSAQSITGTGKLTGTTVNLVANNGNIGSGSGAGQRINTNAGTLTLNGTTLGNAWIFEDDAVTLGASSVANTGQLYVNTLAAGALTVSGALSGNDVRLTTFATGAGVVNVNNTVTGTGVASQVVLFADGSIAGTSQITGATVDLTSTAGSIGAVGARTSTNATNLLAKAATGSVFITEASGVDLGTSSASAAGTFSLIATGLTNINTNLAAGTIQFTSNGGNIVIGDTFTVGTAGTSAVTMAAGGGNISTGPAANSGVIGANLLTLTTAGAGTFGDNATDRLKINATTLAATGAANAWITDGGGLTLNASSTSTGVFDVTTSGTLTISGAVSGNTVVLATTGANDIVVNNTISSTAGAGTSISLNSGRDVTGASTITAGAGSDVSVTAANSITATGNITGNNVSLTATAGSIGQTIANRARTTAASLTLSAANGNVFLTEQDGVNIGASTFNAAGQVFIQTTATGTMNVNTNIGAATVNLLTVNAGSDVVVGNTFTVGAAGGSTTITAGGTVSTGAFAGGGQIQGGTVALTATNGNIGVDATTNRLNVSAGSLSLTATAAGAGVGNAWINEANALSINASTVNKQLFLDTQSSGNITVAGLVQGNDVRLTSFAGTASDIVLNAAITGSGANPNVTLTSAQSITGTGKVSGTTVNLVANNGNIGTGAGAGQRVNTNAGTLTLNGTALGNAWIFEDDAVNLGASAVANAGQLYVTTNAAGAMTVTGALGGNDIRLTTFAGGAGAINVNNTLTASGVSNQVILLADGSITGNSLITGATVDLQATTGSIGTLGVRVNTDTGALSARAAAGSVFITEASGVTLTNSSAGAAGTFSLITTGLTTVNTSLGAGTISFTTNGGNFSVGNTFTVGTAGSSAVTIITGGGNISTGPAGNTGSIAGNGVTLTAGAGTVGDSAIDRLKLNANSVTASGASIWITDVGGLTVNATTTAGALDVSTSGTLTVGGALSANTVTLVATAGGDIAVNSTITSTAVTGTTISLNAANNVTGASTITAGAGSDVSVTAGASINATGNITGNTVTLLATGGNIGQAAATRVRTTANTLVANASNGNVFINEQDGVTLNASGAATGAGQFLLTSLNAGSISVNGALSGDDIRLTTTGAGSDISTTGTGSIGAIATTSNVVLAAGGSITTPAAFANGIQGTVVSLTATNGNIGTSSANANRVYVTAGTLSVSATNALVGQGNAWVREADGVSIIASTANKELMVNTAAAGPLSVDGAVTGNNINLATLDGDIALNANITGSGTSTITLNAGLTGVITGNSTVTGTTVNVTGNSGITSGMVFAGTNVNLTANNNNIGTNSGLRVNTNATNLTLSAVNGSAWINETNAVNIGVSNVANQLFVDTLAAGAITVTGQINNGANTNGDVRLTTFAGGGSNIALNAQVFGGNTTNGVTLLADGSITGTSTVNGNTVSLTATNGNIGTAVARTSTNAANLTANATFGNVFVNESATTVNLGASSGGQFELTKTTAGDITLTGDVLGNTVLIRNTAAGAVNGGISLGAFNILGLAGGDATSVTLIGKGTGAISATTGTVLTSTLSMSTGSGAIGTITTDAAVLSANTTGGVDITDTNASGVTLNASTGGAANTFSLTNNAGGGIAINGAVTAQDITLAVTTTGNGAITRTNAGAVLNATGTLTLISRSDIGSSTTPILTNAGAISVSLPAGNINSVYISEANSLTNLSIAAGAALNFNVSAGGDIVLGAIAATNVNLSTVNGGNITQTSGSISATNLTLTSDLGSFGTNVTPTNTFINTNATTVSANTKGNVFILDTSATNVNLLASSGDTFTMQFNRSAAGAGTFAMSGPLSANTVTLATGNNNSNIALNADIGGLFGGDASSVTITANGTGNITQAVGRTIYTGTLALSSTGGNIGSSATSRINTNAATLVANTTGVVFLNDVGAVDLDGTSGQLSGSTFNLSAGGTITVTDDILANTLVLATANNGSIIANNDLSGLLGGDATSITLNANGSGAISMPASQMHAATVSLTSGSGDIGANGAAIDVQSTTAVQISASTTGDVYISGNSAGTTNFGTINGGIVSLASSSNNGMLLQQNVSGSSSVSLSATGTGLTASINQVAGRNINTPSLFMSSTNGHIGNSGDIHTNAGSLTANAVATGVVNVTDTATGSILLNSLTGNDVTVNATGSGNTLVVNLALSGLTNLNLAAGPGTNGSIFVNAGITAGGTVNLTADGTGSIQNNSGVIAANTLNLSAATGNIGTAFKNIQTTAGVLSINTSGNVFVNDTSLTGIALNTSTGNNFNLKFSSLLTIQGGGNGITGSVVNLTANAPTLPATGVGVFLNNTGIKGTTSVTINASGDGEITELGLANTLIDTPTIVLTSGTGDIGKSGAPIFINATSVTATTGAPGQVFLSNASTGNVNLGPLSGYDFFYANNGNINVVGILDFTNNVTLQTSNNGNIVVGATIRAGNTITLQAGGLGSVTQAASTLLDAPTLVVTSGSGNLGTQTNQITTNAGTLTAHTGGLGNAWVTDVTTGNLILLGENGANNFNLVATNSAATAIYTPSVSDFVSGGTANITSLQGSVGNFLAGTQLNIGGYVTLPVPAYDTLNNLIVNGQVNVTVSSLRDINFGGGTSHAGQLFAAFSGNELSGGSITSQVGATISGRDVALVNADASGGVIALQDAVTGGANGAVALIASGDINDTDFTVINGQRIIIASLDGNVGNTSMVLDNTNAPTLTTLAVASANNVTVNAAKTALTLNTIGIPFTAPVQLGPNLADNGNYTVTNTGNLTVSGAVTANNGNVTLSSGGTLLVNSTVTANTTGASSINLTTNGDFTNANLGASAVLNSTNLSFTSTTGSVGTSGSHLTLTGGTNVNNSINVSVNATTTGKDSYVDFTGTDITIGDSTVANNFFVTSNGNFGSLGTQTANVINWQANTLGATMNLFSSLTGTTSVTLKADSNISNDNGVSTGLISGGALKVTSTNGDIGADTQRLHTAVTSIELHAIGATGEAYASNTGALSVLASNATGDLCIDALGGTLTVNGQLDANGISLLATTVGANIGNVVINGKLNGTGTASLVTIDSANDITTTAVVTANTVIMTATAGDISIGGNVIGIDDNPTSSSLNFIATGGDFSNLPTASITGNGVGNTIDIQAFTLTLNGVGPASKTVNGDDVTLDINASITNSNVAHVAANTLRLISQNDIGGASAANIIQTDVASLQLTANNGSAYVNERNNLTLLASSVNGTMQVTTSAAVGQTQGGNISVNGSLSGDIIEITANGGTPNAGDLTVNAAVNAVSRATLSADGDFKNDLLGTVGAGIVEINAGNDVNIHRAVTSTGASNSITIIAGNDVNTFGGADTGTLSGDTVNVTATAGGLSFGADVTANSVARFTSHDAINNAIFGGTFSSAPLLYVTTTGAAADINLSGFDVTNLVANANGTGSNVTFVDPNDVNIGDGLGGTSHADGTFSVTGGILSNNEKISANHVVLEASTSGLALGAEITGTTDISLKSAGPILNANIGSPSNLVTNQLILESTGGNIGAAGGTGFALLISNASVQIVGANNAYLETAGSLNFGGGSTNVSNTLEVTAANNITSTDGTVIQVNASTLDFTATAGNIGTDNTGAGRISTDAGTIRASASSGSVFMFDGNSGVVNVTNGVANGSGGNVFDLQSAGTIRVNNTDLSGQNVRLDGDQGIQTAGSGRILGSNVYLHTSNGSITNSGGGRLVLGATNLVANADVGDVIITVGGGLNFGVLSTDTSHAGGNFDVRTTQAMTSNAAISAGTKVELFSDFSISLGADVSSATVILTANPGFAGTGDITNTAGGTIKATNALIVMVSDGNIGSADGSARLNIDATNVTAQASTAVTASKGNVYLNDASTQDVHLVDYNGTVDGQAVNFINGAKTTGGRYDLLATNQTSPVGTSIVVNDTVSGDNVFLKSEDGSFLVTATAQITGTTQVDLTSDSSITNANFVAGNVITSPRLNVHADNSFIGSSDGSARLSLDTANVQATASGDVYLSLTNGSGATLVGSSFSGNGVSAGFSFDAIATAGNLSVGSGATVKSPSADTVRLESQTARVVVNGTVDAGTAQLLAATDIGGTGTVKGSTEVQLTATAGIISSDFSGGRLATQTPKLTINTVGGQQIYIANTGSLDFTGANFTSGTSVVDVTTAGNLDVTGLVKADQVTLGATAVVSPALLGTITLDANVTGLTKVTFNADGGIIDNNTVTGPTIVINSGGSVGVGGTGPLEVTGGTGVDCTLTVNASGQTVLIDYVGANFLNLDTASVASNLTITNTNDSAQININPGTMIIGNTLTLNTNVLNLTNTSHLRASTINVNSLTGYNGGLTINGDTTAGASFGTLANPTTATNWTAAAGDVNLFGIVDMYGPVVITTTDASKDVIANGGAVYTGHNQVRINANNLVHQGTPAGILTGTPLVFAGNAIVNNTGNLVLSGNIVAVGTNFALVSAFDVLAGTATSIDLSAVSANGGAFTVLAGYNYTATPSIPSGQQLTDSELSAFTANGAHNINLSGVTITTANTGTGAGNGGAVTMAATGSILNSGTIITSSGNGSGGAVNLMAAGGITAGPITTTGTASDGAVNMTVGTPSIPGTYKLTNGTPSGGTITVPLANRTAGNIAFGNITAGSAAVTLIGGLTGSTITGSGLLDGGTLSVTTGNGVASIGNTSIDTITGSTATGTLSLSNTGNLTLGALTFSGVGQTLNLVTSGTMNHTTGGLTVGTGFATLTAGTFNLIGVGASIGQAGNGTINIRSTGALAANTLGTISGLNVNLIQTNTMANTSFLTGATINATNLGLRVTGAGANIGTGAAVGQRLILPAGLTNVSAISDLGSVFIGSGVANTTTFTLRGGSAGGASGVFDFLGTGTTSITSDVTTTDGDISIVTGINRITVGAGIKIIANGTGPGNGDVLFGVTDTSKNSSKTSIITLSAGAQVKGLAAAAGAGNVTFQIGNASQLTGAKPKSNVTLTPTNASVFWGKGVTANAPSNNLQTKGGASIRFNTLSAKNVVLGGGTLIVADPPVPGAPEGSVVIGGMHAAAATPVAVSASVPAGVQVAAMPEAHQTMFGFDTANAMVTSDLSVLNLNALPNAQAANNATLMTATNTQALAQQAGIATSSFGVNAGNGGIPNGLSGVIGKSAFAQQADDDNSYMVGFMGNNCGETEAAICSDVEVGLAGSSAQGIQKVQHGDRVVIKKGNVLFVPFKATTVETPNGIVHIDAKAVALVSTSDAGLAVYDMEDQHKGSVSVESNGHNVVLSPGRHVTITPHHTAEFGQVNQVETIAHRNIQSVVKNGHRAHTSEFSVLTAMDTVKPLKAMIASKHPEAKHIADRMMKTTAIILQLGGAGGQYQHYFKPRMTAMQR